ncbi:MAG: hypothetical protein RLZZ15_1571 [Verrucomicrobiota bacterium]|jgi:hypothetical protein
MKQPDSSTNEFGGLPAHPRTEEELRQWITNGVEESLTLDYKAKGALAKEKRGEIAKDVSAMANSAGGVVIFGVCEYPKDSGKQHLPEKIDPIDDSQFTKEWLEHVIAGGVRPRIPDLLVHPIRLAGGGAVYVVVVPQGSTAHQAAERKLYFRRYNFEAVAMEDHEIRDVMQRVRHPQVRLTFDINVAKAARSPDPFPPRQSDETVYRWLHIGFLNTGDKSAHHVRAKLCIPISAVDQPQPQVVELRGELFQSIDLDMAWPATNTHYFSVPNKNTDPLLPRLGIKMRTVRLKPVENTFPELPIFYAVYADEAPLFRGQVAFAEIRQRTPSEMDRVIQKKDEPP